MSKITTEHINNILEEAKVETNAALMHMLDYEFELARSAMKRVDRLLIRLGDFIKCISN